MVTREELAGRLQALEREIAQGREGIRKQRRVARQLAGGEADARQASELLALWEDRLFETVIHAESLRAGLTVTAGTDSARIHKPVATMEGLTSAA